MDDLVAFLRARLDEDEQAAHVAASANPGSPATRWSAEKVDRQGTAGWRKVWGVVPERVQGNVLAICEGDILPKVVTHVARHDPAHVLREVEAKRQLLAWIERTGDWAAENNLWTYDRDEPLKVLALAYSDHPDYQESWRL